MLTIRNARIYGISESIIAGGYPMSLHLPTEEEFSEMAKDLDTLLEGNYFSINTPDEVREILEKRIKTTEKLGNVPGSTGHDNLLKGMVVQYDVMYPQYWTPQFQRYSFHDIVSSNSKMHRITRMDVERCCNKYVTNIAIENLQNQIDHYNVWMDGKEKTIAANNISIEDWSEEWYKRFMKVVANAPLGLEQFMRVTTSYLQLKTIYNQRKGHKLKEDWGRYCAWCESLPSFVDFALKGKRLFTDESGEPLDRLYDWRSTEK